MQFSRKFLISSVVVLVAGLLFFQTSAGPAPAAADPSAQGKQDNQGRAFDSLDKSMGGNQKPITVEAGEAKRGELIQRVSAQGRVHAYQDVDIINEVSGRLIKLNITDGDRVKKGQILAEIDQREYLLDYEEAKASYLSGQADYLVYDDMLESAKTKAGDVAERLAALDKQLADGLISRADFERKKFDLELEAIRSGNKRGDVIAAKYLSTAQIKLEKTKITLEKCTIKAPFDGYVFGLEVSEGEFLNANTKLAKLVNMTELVVKAQVLESEIGQVVVGRPVRLTFTALPQLGKIEGTVKAISPFVNETDKTVETVVALKPVPEGIRPGMFSEVTIDARIFKDRLMVPKTAILPRDNRKVVFKVVDSRAKWEYVTTGVENDQFVEIIEGDIKEGDMVLTDNHFTMGHDTLVKISAAGDDDE